MSEVQKKDPKRWITDWKDKNVSEKLIVEFYHVSCAFNMFLSVRTLSNIICNENEIQGFEKLLENDKSALRDKLQSLDPIIGKLKDPP